MTPEGWQRRRIREFGQRLKRVNTDGIELEPLSITKDRGVILQSEKYNKRIATDLRKYILAEDGDFAFDPMSLYYGAIGRVADIGRGLVSPDYVVFAVDETVNHNFLAYLLRYPEMHKTYEALSETGNTFGKRRRLYWSIFEDIELVLPSMNEQKRIGDILSSLDDAIMSSQAVIEQIQVVKKSMMAELLTCGIPRRHTQFKAVELSEWKYGRVDQKIKEIPSEWKLVRLSGVSTLESGHTPSRRHPEYWNGEVPWVSLHDTDKLNEPEILDTAQHISDLGLQNSSARLLPAGTVVFSRTATIGKSTIIGRSMATSQDFANYICGPQLYNRYLMHLFRYMEAEWNRLKAGSTHKTVYMPIFEHLEVLLPTLDEQRAIAHLADTLDDRIREEQHMKAALVKLRDALLSALLSGDLRVTPTEATP